MRLFLPYLRQGRTYFSATKPFFTAGLNFTSNMDVTSRKAQLACDRKKFEESLPKIIDQVIGPHCEQTKDAIEHYRQSLMYNVPGGKMNRGMTVLATWRLLLGDRTPTDDEYSSAIALAWCVEL
ncbi:Farnesyl pyrophosphate synthase, partial [Paramuricea clavata]